VQTSRLATTSVLTLVAVGLLTTACGSKQPYETLPDHQIIDGGAAKAPTPGGLATAVEDNLKSPPEGQEAVTGLSDVSCLLPATWKPEATFICVGKDAHGTTMGTYHGTVTENGEGGQFRWTGRWVPAAG
jgi:hypothetical protein